jgi:hypothetical protein
MYIVCGSFGSKASEPMFRLGAKSLRGVQCRPPSVDFQRPPVAAPAKRI